MKHRVEGSMGVRWRNLLAWYLDHRQGAGDLLALILACGLSCALVFVLRVGDGFHALSHRLPAWHLMEWVLCLALLALFLALFAWRRWREASGLLADAGTDPLTGLHNRRKILRALRQEFERSRRYGKPLSLVLFDVDHFKRINDSFGHPAGDAVLVAIARRVARRKRATDALGRWGGEEFLLVCPETDLEGAVRVAERMRRSIKHRPVGRMGTVTASFGVATSDGHMSLASLMEKVDCLLYVAKDHGRDRVAYRLEGHPPEPGDSDEEAEPALGLEAE